MISNYLIENRYLAIKRCKHGLFMFNRNDAFIGRSLDLYGEWCDFETQLMRPYIKPGDTIIDAGANIGIHSVAFANMVGPGGRVHAIEPQGPNFHILAGNVALNTLDNVICHQAAVGDSNGFIKLPPLPSPDSYFNFGIVPKSRDPNADVSVPLITLDSLNLPTCKVIKIDVEGMEEQTINGAKALIARSRPLIYVECNTPEASKALNKALTALGYNAWWSIVWLYNQYNFYANPFNAFENVVPACNLLCVPKEQTVHVGELEPYQGENDDWKKCVLRVSERMNARK